MIVNTKQITRPLILQLMLEDGFGPDEVLGHSKVYAKELTGNTSPTAVAIVERHARGIIREAKLRASQ